MSVLLGQELRQRVWAELDWSKAAPELAAQLVGSENMTPAQKAPYLRQLAELCEFCVIDPQAAADLYGASFQADRSQVEILGRMRELCEAVGRFDHAARTAELEFRETREPRFQALAGQSWLDAGEPDRALKPLLAVASVSPGNPHVETALEVARREWANPETHAEALIERARAGGPDAALVALQAARILNMLDFDDERFEEALRLCLHHNPNLASAFHLMEVFLLEQERHDDLARHFLIRAQNAPNAENAANTLFKGSSLLMRIGAADYGVSLFAKGLEQARNSGATSIPGALALLRAVAASGTEGRMHVVEYASEIYDQLTSADEQVGVAIFCAQIAWYAQKDFAEAALWMERLRLHCPQHQLLVDFELAAEILKAEQAPSPAPVTAPTITPPSANPGAAEKRRAPRVPVVANIELQMETKDRMGTISKIDAVTRDISTVGALIRCDKDLKLDQNLDIVLQIPSSSGLTKRRFSVKARVARSVPGKGYGLEWVDASFDFKTAITALPDPTA